MAKITENAIRRITSLPEFPLPPIWATRYPVVLMHGFGMLAGIRRGGHLSTAAAFLRQRGVRAYSPNVTPYHTVEARSTMWKARIEHVLEECKTDRVNLIAHSMGGLDARYLISVMGLHTVVNSLVTLSSPHRGSYLATYLQSQPERLTTIVTEFANWLGSNALVEGNSDFETAVRQLTPDFVIHQFNPAVLDHPSVKYWSLAGQAGKGPATPINPVLRVFNSVLYEMEGNNDGMVSVESAKWGEFLGTVEADHMQQVGLSFMAGKFSANDIFSRIAALLVEYDF
ncbi:MAG: lipase [Rhodothermales bacterium]|nr:lipase [Rhodothermales bacterium]